MMSLFSGGGQIQPLVLKLHSKYDVVDNTDAAVSYQTSHFRFADFYMPNRFSRI